LAIELL
jgi:origin recognition complex subunit 1